ncbi:MAG: TonB-dependent receptor [Sulfurimonas sp.]|nr:MAG: TonB-dependent receptor [Sulfurimonas sp.]
MSRPKGFGKNYFTLSAIQAYSAQVTLTRRLTTVAAHHHRCADDEDIEVSVSAEDDPLLLLERDTPEHIAEDSVPHSTPSNASLYPAPFTCQLPNILPNKGISMIRKPLLLSLAAAVSAASFAHAATYKLHPLEVRSSPLHYDELGATESVEIYTQDDIQKAHVQSVYEFLNQQTSLTAVPSYGNPFTQKLDMHGYGIGTGYENIVIILNGRRLNNLDMVPQLLGAIAPSTISRIEIIKSGGVVLGGDGANAGVINIMTKTGDAIELGLYAGNNRTYDGSLSLGYTSEFYSVSAHAEHYYREGARTVDAEGNSNEQRLKNGGISLTLTPTDALELALGYQASRLKSTYGGALTLNEFSEDPNQAGSNSSSKQEYDSDVYSLSLAYDVSDHLLVNVYGSREEKTSRYVTYGSVAEYTYDSLNTTLDYDAGALSTTIGMELFNGERDGYGNTTSKDNLAAFILTRYRHNMHTFKAGYRYERVSYRYRDAGNSLDDDETLYGLELGYNYRLSPERSLFVSLARSYQAPDIDRFFNFGGTFNAFIDPMTTLGVTLGYNAITPDNKFKMALYYVDLDNEIYYHADPTFVNAKNTNIDASHKYGLDLYNKFLVTETFHVTLNYNYVKAIIDKEIESGDNYKNSELPGVPNHTAKVMLSYLPNENVTLSLLHTHRSSAYAADDFNNNFAQKQQTYRSTDITASYQKNHYELFAKINNLFDQKNGLWIHDDAIYPFNASTSFIVGLKAKY